MKFRVNSILAFICLVIIAFGFTACENNQYPKPRGYFRIEFPVKEYKDFDPVNCPFKFKIPVYSNVILDTLGLVEPCWYDLDFPGFNAKVHLSYKKIIGDFFKHTEDTRKLVYKHAAKADAIDPYYINPSDNVSGMIYEIGGNAASSIQFFVSDSTNHFIRGALYFYCSPNADSLAPVIQFIRKDIETLISTVNWK